MIETGGRGTRSGDLCVITMVGYRLLRSVSPIPATTCKYKAGYKPALPPLCVPTVRFGPPGPKSRVLPARNGQRKHHSQSSVAWNAHDPKACTSHPTGLPHLSRGPFCSFFVGVFRTAVKVVPQGSNVTAINNSHIPMCYFRPGKTIGHRHIVLIAASL